jgi:hypothetical protein
VESSGRERLMMDGRASKAVRSEIYSLEAREVNSAVWVQERAGHKGQGSSPWPEHPVNLSWVLAPDVRYCRIKTTPHVENKDLLRSRPQSCPPTPHSFPKSGSSGLAEMSGVFHRRVQAMGEGESVWSLIICGHQIERVNMPG